MAEKDFHVSLPQEVVGGFGWKESEVPSRVRDALVMDLYASTGYRKRKLRLFWESRAGSFSNSRDVTMYRRFE